MAFVLKTRHANEPVEEFGGRAVSQKAMIEDSRDWNKTDIVNIRNKLRESAKKLSVLKDELKVIYTSVDSSQTEERFLIIHTRENIERIQGIWAYVVGTGEQFLSIKKEKVS